VCTTHTCCPKAGVAGDAAAAAAAANAAWRCASKPAPFLGVKKLCCALALTRGVVWGTSRRARGVVLSPACDMALYVCVRR
jgi:hypothetical protein